MSKLGNRLVQPQDFLDRASHGGGILGGCWTLETTHYERFAPDFERGDAIPLRRARFLEHLPAQIGNLSQLVTAAHIHVGPLG
jgi:hypothetical protein